LHLLAIQHTAYSVFLYFFIFSLLFFESQ